MNKTLKSLMMFLFCFAAIGLFVGCPSSSSDSFDSFDSYDSGNYLENQKQSETGAANPSGASNIVSDFSRDATGEVVLPQNEAE